MGIRVHKLLGYGLTDVQVNEDGEITDERIDPMSILLNYDARRVRRAVHQSGRVAPTPPDDLRLLGVERSY